MPFKKQIISYALGDQSYNEDYPKILLEFLAGTRTIDDPNTIERVKQQYGSKYKGYITLLSQIYPIGIFMLTYGLSYETIREYISKHPDFKKAYIKANTGSLHYINTAYFLGFITDKQHARALRIIHGINVDAPIQQQPSLPKQPQQITVQNS